MVQSVAGLQLGEIENCDTGFFKLAAIGLDRWIDLAETVDIARNAARQAERAVILRNEKREFRRGFAEACELPAEYVHIQIRRREDDIADLRIDTAIADGHLAQRLHRKPGAHGMGHDRDLADGPVLGEAGQHFLQRIARIVGAFLVVVIVKDARSRRPGEDDGHDVSAGIMDDLREAINGFLVPVVETVNEDQHAPVLLDVSADPASGLGFGANGLHRHRGEILQRIGRQLLRPLHLPDLAVGVGRNGNRHRIHLQTRSTLAAKKHGGVFRWRAGGGDEKIDRRGSRHGLPRRRHDPDRTPPATGEQGDNGDYGHEANGHHITLLQPRGSRKAAGGEDFLPEAEPPRQQPDH
ncbi:hypothetical protein D3C86_1306290 [compost metagenome]